MHIYQASVHVYAYLNSIDKRQTWEIDDTLLGRWSESSSDECSELTSGAGVTGVVANSSDGNSFEGWQSEPRGETGS